MGRVLVVDDDPGIRDLLCEYLIESGMHPMSAGDGKEMWFRLEESTPDVIVLDLMLPGEDGLVLCRQITEKTGIPVIMVSARGSLTDRVVGLELGADDYLAKPFDPRELLARIRVVMRRAQKRSLTQVSELSIFEFAGWVFDPRLSKLIAPNGKELRLGQSDTDALRVLIDPPYRTVSREELVRRVYSKPHDPRDRAIDVCISRLRQIFKNEDPLEDFIRTVRNGGYSFIADVNVK